LLKAVPTALDNLVSPGVSLALHPAIANESAANAKASPQVYKLLHRAALKLSEDAAHAQFVATLRDAFDRGYDAVMLRNIPLPRGKRGDITIVRDANQLRSVNARF
jgi:hypothetical protein